MSHLPTLEISKALEVSQGRRGIDRDQKTCYKVTMPRGNPLDRSVDRVPLAGVPRALADRVAELARVERRTIQAQTELVVEAGLEDLETQAAPDD